MAIGTRHGLGGFLGGRAVPHCDRAQRILGDPQLAYGIGFYQILGYSLLFIGCVLALRALVLVFRRSWSP